MGRPTAGKSLRKLKRTAGPVSSEVDNESSMLLADNDQERPRKFQRTANSIPTQDESENIAESLRSRELASPPTSASLTEETQDDTTQPFTASLVAENERLEDENNELRLALAKRHITNASLEKLVKKQERTIADLKEQVDAEVMEQSDETISTGFASFCCAYSKRGGRAALIDALVDRDV